MEIKTTITCSCLAAAAQVVLNAKYGKDRWVSFATDEDMMNAIGDIAEALGLPSRIQIAAFDSLQLTTQRLKNGATE